MSEDLTTAIATLQETIWRGVAAYQHMLSSDRTLGDQVYFEERCFRCSFQATKLALCTGGNDPLMSDPTSFPSPARYPLPWFTVCVFAVLAWIPTLQQALKMLSLSAPLFGTMGLALGPFLWFWTLMMAAMMFPALAPMVAIRSQDAREQTGNWLAFSQMLVFVFGYLFTWTLFGVPTFFSPDWANNWCCTPLHSALAWALVYSLPLVSTR